MHTGAGNRRGRLRYMKGGENVVFLPLIMPEKKRTRSTPISDSEILALYEAIIPLLSHNPEGLDITSQINKRLLTFVHYDFYHYLMDAPTPDRIHGRLDMSYEKWENFGSDTIAHSVSMKPSSGEGLEMEFEEIIERNYQSVLDRSRALHPENSEYHYHRIESRTNPRIVIGFFRRKDTSSNIGFTREEKYIFEILTPHLISLYRAVLNQVCSSQGFQYFNTFAHLSSNLANNYSLSESEVRIIPDILFGHNNEGIALKHFISVETVKSHIKHILKKTGTKNRIDFISKFFTSPDSVQL
jgi:DNA-binding CsgD family transcriptional regulator